MKIAAGSYLHRGWVWSRDIITLSGYHEPIRHDRAINGRHGGGVLVYIAEHLVFQHKNEFQTEYYEHIWVDIKVNNKTFAINALYRPPNETLNDHQMFLETAEKILSRLNDYDKAEHKIIASDLNFGNCYCKFPVLAYKLLDNSAPDIFSSFGFRQVIDIPTRVTANKISLVDLIYVSDSENIQCHGALPRRADYDGVFVSFNAPRSKPKQSVS